MTATGAKLWGGRFQGGLHPIFDRLNRSLPFDRRMLDQDLDGSAAWARAIAGAGVFSAADAEEIATALEEIRGAVAADPSLIEQSTVEDVHTFVEEQLTARVGDLGKRLHTGRSRNDQVATDLKLYLRLQVPRLVAAVRDLQRALVTLADAHAATILAGYTHLQRAQPITFGHQCLAYVEMLERDAGRLEDAARRMETCPLGASALAGTAYPVDRDALAAALDFAGGPARNSLDAVSDRDHALELVFACTQAMLHLSRLAEDWIFLGSQESAVLSFGDSVSTGSSLMPQKRNPDALELLRGKVGRVHGALTTLITTTKGLPLAYDKDLQEDKEALFGALDTTETCLQVAALVVRDTQVDRARGLAAVRDGFLDATDLADLLVGAGVPFREAHDRVGGAVGAAVAAGCGLADLSTEDRGRWLPELAGADLAGLLSPEAIIARRDVIGGTAASRVRAEVARWKERLAQGGA